MESFKFWCRLKKREENENPLWTTFFNFKKYPLQVQNDKTLISRLFSQAIENKRSQNTDHLCPFLGRRRVYDKEERVQIDWQWPLSGLHSIMIVNSARSGEGGGCMPCPPPFTLSTITSKVVVVCAPAERADTLLLAVSPLPCTPLWSITPLTRERVDCT